MVDTVKLAGDLKQQELFEMQKPLQECLIEIGIPDKSGSFLFLVLLLDKSGSFRLKSRRQSR